MKCTLKAFFARKDVWFNILTGITTALLLYAQYLPTWALISVVILQVLLRELFGAVGMVKNQNGTADQSSGG